MNTEQQAKEAPRQVLQAVLCLPGSLGTGLGTALLQAPSVVEMESDPVLFLLHEQSVSRAALKLAIYWNRRVAIFGQRAFLPMNKTGMGALTPQDINALDDSCLHPLPRDHQGHAVFLVDLFKVTSYASATGIRGLFYQLQQQTENKNAPLMNGAVFLLPVHSHTRLTELHMFINAMTRLIDTFVPVAPCRFHFLPMSNIDETLIPGAVQLLLHNHLTSCVVTVGSTPQDFFYKLSPFGLSKEGLPAFLGGSFNLFTPRQQQAATHQMGRPMPFHGMRAIPNIPLAQHHYPTVPIHQSQNDASRTMPRDVLDAQVQLEPTLRITAAASTPFKDQEASKKLTLKTLPQEPQGEQQVSFEDRLLDQPMLLAIRKPAAVESTGAASAGQGSTAENPEDLRKEFVKKRNALYSKRKYIKKKIEIEVLGKQSQTLTAQNVSLKKEHERLEKLVRKAKAVIQRSEMMTGHNKKMPPPAPLPVNAFHAVHRPLSNNSPSSSDKKMPPCASLPMEKKASQSCSVHFTLTNNTHH